MSMVIVSIVLSLVFQIFNLVQGRDSRHQAWLSYL